MGMPRRVFTYPDLPGWGALNMASTVGAVIMGVSVIVFALNLGMSLRRGALAGDNPWNAWSLEWATTSPPSPHNFERVPPVRSRRPLWDLKHPSHAGAEPSAPRPEPEKRALPDKSVVAVWAFIVSETAFFIVLILAFVFFNLSTTAAAAALDVKTTAVFTACLLASSVTLHLAEKSLERANDGAFRAWMVATLVLGLVFMGGQAHEYLELFDSGVSVNSSLFTTTFFTLTGFHGLHVTLGLVALGILAGLGFAGDFHKKPSRALKAVGLYWHFVDVVWVFVFAIVYVRSAL
jgi:heme/copper-type cytochrome/quinol oxidase subunit 3